MVTEEPFTGNLNTHKVMAETQFMTNFLEYEKLSESEVTLDGKTDTQIIFHGKPKNNQVILKFLVDTLPYDGCMARLTFTTLEPLFNDGLPVFNKIAASYRRTSQ